MIIRECHAEDIDLLDRRDPTSGRNAWHAKRLEKQGSGAATYLVAFVDNVPVGQGPIIWPGSPDRNVRMDEQWPDCPEINGLAVYEQNKGFGTALIHAAEDLARERGHRRIGMGVTDDNPDAGRLYRRLGYQPQSTYVGSYTYVDEDGVKHEISETCLFMTLDL